MSHRICFIGAGNMASSLIGGMIANGFDAGKITACDIDDAQLKRLRETYGIGTDTDSAAVAGSADVVILAVKPQVMRAVCSSLADLPSNERQMFISIAAGVPIAAIDEWLGGGRAIVRCMPNTPSLLQLGATGLAAGEGVTAEQRKLAQNILEAVGIAIWVDEEDQLDAVTAVSGSGPAYFFYFIELLAAAGVKLGLDADTSGRLARQTAFGAASMALDEDVVELRARVTSRKGTTEQAILSMQHDGLERLINNATAAAERRGRELAREMTDAERS